MRIALALPGSIAVRAMCCAGAAGAALGTRAPFM